MAINIRQGKNNFTKTEAGKIEHQLDLIRKAERTEQKTLRDELRHEMQFFISDFTKSRKGFTVEDFRHLISNQEITIV